MSVHDVRTEPRSSPQIDAVDDRLLPGCDGEVDVRRGGARVGDRLGEELHRGEAGLREGDVVRADGHALEMPGPGCVGRGTGGRTVDGDGHPGEVIEAAGPGIE